MSTDNSQKKRAQRPVFLVERPGLMTSIQDLGRYGCQKSGMVVAGAMDSLAARVANIMLGNPDNDAVLETTLTGPCLLALADGFVAVTGADLRPAIDGCPAAMWTPLLLREGQTLRFGRRRAGARAYIAVAGGVDVPLVLGSRSTYLRGTLGGFDGRLLASGDIVYGGLPPRDCSSLIGWFAPAEISDLYENAGPGLPLRMIDGPLAGDFTQEGLRTLMQREFVVGVKSDRMGYQLEGPAIERRSPHVEILSEPVVAGALQALPDGLMLLMADRQTTGGYPIIGVVCTIDLPRAAQLVPGDAVRFTSVDLSEAQSALLARERLLGFMRVSVSLR